MIDFLKEAVCDDRTGRASTTRIVMLISAVTLCLSTVWLAFAAFWMVELVPALTAFGGSLALMAGSGYVSARAWQGKKDD